MSGITRIAGRLRFAAALSLLLLAGLGPARAPGWIVGRVTDLAGNPLAEATVTMQGADGLASRRGTRSGETGGFQFAELEPGSYRVTAERAGYAPATQAVALGDGERRTLIFRLAPARR